MRAGWQKWYKKRYTMEKLSVAVLMGSDSDLPVVREALAVLKQFHVAFEVRFLSAHRSPDATVSYVTHAKNRGIKVFIAAAGGAAHLAGVIAAHTTLPVIGIPMATPSLGGADSLYATVQMPPGVPVATVGIGAAKNAGLLSVQILALSDKRLEKMVKEYKADLEQTIQKKNTTLARVGWEAYGTK